MSEGGSQKNGVWEADLRMEGWRVYGTARVGGAPRIEEVWSFMTGRWGTPTCARTFSTLDGGSVRFDEPRVSD